MSSSIVIAPIGSVVSLRRRYAFSHVVSILGGRDDVEFPSFGVSKVLQLKFDDVGYSSEYGRAASAADISSLIEFSSSWMSQGNLLVHCKAGTSRSPAAGMIILAALMEQDREVLIRKLLSMKAYYRPNTTMLRIADQLLSTGGLLVSIAHSLPVTDAQSSLGFARLVLDK